MSLSMPCRSLDGCKVAPLPQAMVRDSSSAYLLVLFLIKGPAHIPPVAGTVLPPQGSPFCAHALHRSQLTFGEKARKEEKCGCLGCQENRDLDPGCWERGLYEAPLFSLLPGVTKG